ncbi:MAG: two-component system OmpR family response regulator [Polaribacter sp.]|jgi:two-component system OmpR family response regulator
MIKIFWVEDQFHWIDRFHTILQHADFSIDAPVNESKEDLLASPQINEVNIYRFEEAARHAINQSSKQNDFKIPDIVILDANMNGDNDAGLALSKLINKVWPQVPIIFLSEHSGTATEEKVFENTQSRDFIAKHQENIEKVLCWRIKALLRSTSINQSVNSNTNSSKKNDKQIILGELLIDLVTWNVYWHGEKLMNPKNSERPLAPTPRKILRYLVEASPNPLTTLQMEGKLNLDRFNYASYRQHIKALRHSFENASENKKLPSFIDQCTNEQGIVTFGDEGAYCWKQVRL